MNRTKWTRPEKLLWLMPGLFLASVGALIYAPRFSRSFEVLLENIGIPSKENARRSSCQSNLKQIGLGISQYARDYDEKFPLVALGGTNYGWADALQPYLKSTQIYHCPKTSIPGTARPTQRGYIDYFYNARLAGRNLAVLNNAAQTVAFGEGPISDARSSQSQLPPEWISNRDSPARRHYAVGSATRSGANYAFTDGHVKWFEPQFIGTAPTLVNSNVSRAAASTGAPTFSLR